MLVEVQRLRTSFTSLSSFFPLRVYSSCTLPCKNSGTTRNEWINPLRYTHVLDLVVFQTRPTRFSMHVPCDNVASIIEMGFVICLEMISNISLKFLYLHPSPIPDPQEEGSLKKSTSGVSRVFWAYKVQPGHGACIRSRFDCISWLPIHAATADPHAPIFRAACASRTHFRSHMQNTWTGLNGNPWTQPWLDRIRAKFRRNHRRRVMVSFAN